MSIYGPIYVVVACETLGTKIKGDYRVLITTVKRKMVKYVGIRSEPYSRCIQISLMSIYCFALA